MRSICYPVLISILLTGACAAQLGALQPSASPDPPLQESRLPEANSENVPNETQRNADEVRQQHNQILGEMDEINRQITERKRVARAYGEQAARCEEDKKRYEDMRNKQSAKALFSRESDRVVIREKFLHYQELETKATLCVLEFIRKQTAEVEAVSRLLDQSGALVERLQTLLQ